MEVPDAFVERCNVHALRLHDPLDRGHARTEDRAEGGGLGTGECGHRLRVATQHHEQLTRVALLPRMLDDDPEAVVVYDASGRRAPAVDDCAAGA